MGQKKTTGPRVLENVTAPAPEGLDAAEDSVCLLGHFPAYHYLGPFIDTTALRSELPSWVITTHR